LVSVVYDTAEALFVLNLYPLVSNSG